MEYLKHYNLLIGKAQEEKRIKTKESYYEKHHIVPKSEGGSDIRENTVLLTAREHFIAHWLLYRDNPNSQSRAYAFWKMCTQHSPKQNRYTPSSRIYEEARLGFREANSKTHKGKSLTEKHKKQISDRRKGKATRSGFTHTEQTRQRISAAKKGTASWNKGIPRTANEKKAISDAKKGVENPKKWRAVQQLDPTTGSLVQEFSSLKETRQYGFCPSAVRNCCHKNKTRTKQAISAGYKWIYKE
jgi:hypothetical protein